MKGWHSLPVLLALGAATVVTGDPAPARPADPPAAPAAGRIDPNARALLDEMAAAYRALPSYAGEVEVRSQGGAHDRTVRANLLLRRPDRAAISVSDRSGAML